MTFEHLQALSLSLLERRAEADLARHGRHGREPRAAKRRFETGDGSLIPPRLQQRGRALSGRMGTGQCPSPGNPRALCRPGPRGLLAVRGIGRRRVGPSPGPAQSKLHRPAKGRPRASPRPTVPPTATATPTEMARPSMAAAAAPRVMARSTVMAASISDAIDNGLPPGGNNGQFRSRLSARQMEYVQELASQVGMEHRAARRALSATVRKPPGRAFRRRSTPGRSLRQSRPESYARCPHAAHLKIGVWKIEHLPP